MDLLDSMKAYVLTVEKGSLSAAGTASGISATMVVYLPDRYRSSRLRSFIDYIAERFGQEGSPCTLP